MRSPFDRSPNVMVIELPTGSHRLRLAPFATPWGESDEMLCFWDDVLFGQAVQGERAKFARLLPKLDRQRAYPWPSAEAFRNACVSILDQHPDLEILCELDCDQNVVEQVESSKEVHRYLERVLAFCMGASLDCPSFSYRVKATPESAGNHRD